MEIYFSDDVKITKLVSHNKSIYTTYKLAKRKKYNFLGFQFGEEEDVYVTDGYYSNFKTLEGIKDYWNGHDYIVEENNNGSKVTIYLKPHVDILLSNRENYIKYFDTEDEMQKYIDGSDVILNKII